MKALSSAICLCLALSVSLAQAEAIRDYYDEPGINPFKKNPDQDFSENVDSFSGMLQVSMTDVYLPGNGGFDVAIKRSYATPYVTNEELSPYGYGWTMHFGRVVVSANDASKVCNQRNWATSVSDNPSIELPDGSRKLLVVANYHSPGLITKDWWSANCSGGDVIVKSPDGTTYHMTYFATAGDLTSIYATYIEDANGNSMSVNYQTNPSGFTYIDDLSTSDGRMVDFTYLDANGSDIRLSSVATENQTWTYQYTFPSGILQAPPQLSRIVRPDSREWEFDYNPVFTQGEAGSLALDSITTPMGGTLSYEYDHVHFESGAGSPTTVVTSKTTGGTGVTSGTWTYDYTPGYQSGSGYDETVIFGPDNIRKDYHIGYSSVWSGNVWRTGLKEYEELYDAGGALQEQIRYTYAQLLLSEENFWHGRDTTRIDQATYVPVLQETYHYRDGRSVQTAFSNFTDYGQPQLVTETSTILNAADRVTAYTYANLSAPWILGLVEEEVINVPTDAPTDSWTIERTFDPQGNMLSESLYGVETTYTYTSEGDISTITDANGNTTTLSNYYRGIARQENQPEGVSISRTVNGSGTLASVTDGRGFTTTFSWDALNRLTGIDYPINADVMIAYGSNQRSLTRGAFEEVVTWDGFGRELDVTRSDTANQVAITLSKTRDELGRVQFESYPNSADGVTFDYDEFGRKLYEQHSNGDLVSYAYPTPSEVVVTDENGNVTEKRFSHRGSMDDEEAQLIQTSSPEGIVTYFTRNGIDQVWEVFQGERQPDGQVFGWPRIYNHNAKGFLVSEEHPETGVTSYTYDLVGNRLTRVVGTNGVTESFQYDDRNRLVAKSYSDSTPAVAYGYDDDDNLLSSDNGIAARSFAYDENGNLTSETLSVGGSAYTLTYSPGNLDFVDSLTYPSGRSVSLTPDALGRQTRAGTYVTDVQYHPSGVPASVTLANGITNTSQLDARLRPTSIKASTGSVDIVDLTYGYDNSFNVLSVADHVGNLHDHTLAYDSLDRLVSASGPWGSETVSYDGVGNISARDRNGTIQEYYYSNLQLTYRVFPAYYLTVSHDARGNLTSDGVNQFTYNAANKLVTASTGSGTVAYGYDGDGMRVSRSDSSGDVHYFYNASGLLIGEYNPAGGFDEYVYVNTKLAARIHEDTAVVGAP